MSGILLEIVMRAIQQQPDMTVRHYEKDLAGLALAVGDETDVLIWGAPVAYPPPTIFRNLWHSFPSLKIFVLTPRGDPAVMYWLEPRSVKNQIPISSYQYQSHESNFLGE